MKYLAPMILVIFSSLAYCQQFDPYTTADNLEKLANKLESAQNDISQYLLTNTNREEFYKRKLICQTARLQEHNATSFAACLRLYGFNKDKNDLVATTYILQQQLKLCMSQSVLNIDWYNSELSQNNESGVAQALGDMKSIEKDVLTIYKEVNDAIDIIFIRENAKHK